MLLRHSIRHEPQGMRVPPSFILIDLIAETVRTADADAVVEAAGEAAPGGPAVIGACGHAGFRVPDVRPLVPVIERLAHAAGAPVRLESALADARHASDDRGCSPVRVRVEIDLGPSGVETRKERLRIGEAADRYVSRIPFVPPKSRQEGAVSHRTVLDAYRRVLSGEPYRWVSDRVVAAAERALAAGEATLLDFHRSLRDLLLEEQLHGVDAARLVPTVATAHPAGYAEHIARTHQAQAAVAVDLLRDEAHTHEVIRFFRTVREAAPEMPLPRWAFSPAEPASYFCRGFTPGRGMPVKARAACR